MTIDDLKFIGTLIKDSFGWLLVFGWCGMLLCVLWAFAK